MLWECSEGHKWKAVPSSIKQGTWCPKCSGSLGERICREFFEQIFNQSFPTEHPEWLINSKGNKMHLDGYCPKLKIAFEHHGLQHYSLNPPFAITEQDLLRGKDDDDLKKKLCREYGVKLIEIPEIPSLLSIKKVKSFLKNQFLKNNILIPPNYHRLEIDYSRAYITPISRRQWENLLQIIQDNGGKCLSDTYVNAREKILVECKNGHQWWAFPDNLRRGTWCQKCGIRETTQNRRSGINKMQEVARKRGGECLSKEYVNNVTKLLWECSEGHQWKATPRDVNYGTWCPKCAGNTRLLIDEMKELANQKGGKCLSEYYINNDTKLVWECSKGHHWEATPKGIKYKGTWCPICGGSSRLSIEEMQEIAAIRGGKCLSECYVNTITKLLWECKEGHQWNATPKNIRKGEWCPVCSRKKRKQTKSVQQTNSADA